MAQRHKFTPTDQQIGRSAHTGMAAHSGLIESMIASVNVSLICLAMWAKSSSVQLISLACAERWRRKCTHEKRLRTQVKSKIRHSLKPELLSSQFGNHCTNIYTCYVRSDSGLSEDCKTGF